MTFWRPGSCSVLVMFVCFAKRPFGVLVFFLGFGFAKSVFWRLLYVILGVFNSLFLGFLFANPRRFWTPSGSLHV